MQKKIYVTTTNTFEAREYILVNPAWLEVLFDLSKEEAGKILINLCLKYGKQPNRNLINMEEKTELVFKMMLADQEALDYITKALDDEEWVNIEEDK